MAYDGGANRGPKCVDLQFKPRMTASWPKRSARYKRCASSAGFFVPAGMYASTAEGSGRRDRVRPQCRSPSPEGHEPRGAKEAWGQPVNPDAGQKAGEVGPGPRTEAPGDPGSPEAPERARAEAGCSQSKDQGEHGPRQSEGVRVAFLRAWSELFRWRWGDDPRQNNQIHFSTRA